MNSTTSITASMSRTAVWMYILLTVSLVPTILGVVVGPTVPSGLGILSCLVVAIGLIWAAHVVSKSNPVLGVVLFLAFTFVEGLSIAPIISAYMVDEVGQAAIFKALFATAAIFVGLSMWTWIKGFDTKSWGPYLFAALLGLIVVMVLSLFFPTPFGQTLISVIAVVLFSLFIVHDTSELVHERENNAVTAAIGMYLNLMNLFLHLLRLFGGRK